MKSNNRFEILTPNGWDDFGGIIKKDNKETIHLEFSNGDTVVATPDHIFFMKGEKIKCSSLKVGDCIDCDVSIINAPHIVSISFGKENVYDIVEVSNEKHQFVLSNCFISKNCDEFAFVPPNKATPFWTSIQPILSTGGSCIITSTPKSDEDQFAQIWKGAIDNVDEYGNPRKDNLGKNNFYAVKVPWWEHPERDEEWAKPFRESLGEARFRQEFECEFVTDDETLINPLALARMKSIQPEFYTGTVRWYKEPSPGKTYIAALDPSVGTGRDYAAIEVYELPEMIQIAEWQHNTTPPRGQVAQLMKILLFIDQTLRDDPKQSGEPDIFWTIENNGLGEAILQIIEDTGEERFPGVFVSEKKRKGQTRRFRKGLNTDNKKKLSACARAKSLIESDRMIINSGQLVKELKTFVALENSFKGKSGTNDDLVSAMLLCVRMLDTVLLWSNQSGDLKEYIDEEELFGDIDPMPVVV